MEFKGSPYSYQKSASDKAINSMVAGFDYLMRTYSEHWYGGDQTTVTVFNENPYFRIWWEPTQSGIRPDAVIETDGAVSLESSTGVIEDTATFQQKYDAYAFREFHTLQGHPNQWDAASRARFTTILDFLVARGAKFTTTWEFYKRLRGVTDTTPPSVPNGVGLTLIDAKGIRVSWSASVDAESAVDGYAVFRNEKFVGMSPASSYDDVSDTALMDSDTYRVRAINRANLWSGKSPPVSIAGTASGTPRPPTNLRLK